MNLSIYMAFTGAESAAMASFKGKSAWFGCRLSSHNSGISILSPPNSRCDLLILTDETPPDGHDPSQVAKELAQAARQMQCEAILLDFQRTPTRESLALVHAASAEIHCPVVVSTSYAVEAKGPILLSPPPLWVPLREAIEAWAGREIWLEIAPENGRITLTEEGSVYTPCESTGPFPFRDESLHLSYNISRRKNSLQFQLQRSDKDLQALLAEARELGICAAIGLYQQLGTTLFSEILPCNRQDL